VYVTNEHHSFGEGERRATDDDNNSFFCFWNLNDCHRLVLEAVIKYISDTNHSFVCWHSVRKSLKNKYVLNDTCK
jgi:hypothetical protein